MIGIIGKGFVGGAVEASYRDVIFYDPYKPGGVDSIKDLENCEAIYISVPTPMSSTGACDDSIVRSSLDELVKIDYKGVVIAKSTAPYTTYESYGSLNLTFIPEFLREATAIEDYLSTTFMIIGANSQEAFDQAVKVIDHSSIPCTTFKHVSIREACLIKYFENSFLATKVSLFNEFRKLTDTLGCDWENVRSSLSMDQRIGPSHTMVPGPDGKFGWGGHCFPKDTAAIVSTAKSVGIDLETLEAAISSNKKFRN
jgi:UDPglucose 6-dehydrogenase